LNSKIIVFAAVGILGLAFAGILLAGPEMAVTGTQNPSDDPNVLKVKPLEIELQNLSVDKITERSATIKVAFKVANPNPRAVIVESLQYRLYETTYSDDEQIAGGEIGSRPTAMLEFGSNYYTLLGNNAIVLKENIEFKSHETDPELWDLLKNDSPTWRVIGDVFYNLSSMTSGQENILPFEFP
jgi:hypothetical protein